MIFSDYHWVSKISDFFRFFESVTSKQSSDLIYFGKLSIFIKNFVKIEPKFD